MRVLVSDPLAQDGLDILQEHTSVDVKTNQSAQELIDAIGDYDALVVRSGTQVTANVIHAANRLQVIGRAGVGVDNIDIDAATARGILVVNAPDGNSIAAAEHSIAMLMALTRHIPQADASLREHKWARKQFIGVEVTGKTIGVIGMGRIGRAVARRARGLDMRVLAHDPYISSAHAERLGVTLCELDALLAKADFITIHVPLTEATRGLIGARELMLVKPTARLINCARGGIVDEGALNTALLEGRLAGAALDVFSHEPPFDSALLDAGQVVVTPHLGASTREAQVAVAVDIAHQVIDVLNGKPAAHPINAPFVPPETQARLLPFCELAQKLGCATSQLVDKHLNQVHIRYAGQLADMDTNLLRALVIKGLLQDVSESRITLVNANLVARERGLDVVEEKTSDAGHFANLITISFQDNGQQRVLSGTIVHSEPYIVRIDQYWMDFRLHGYQLLVYNRDQPGMIGEVGRVTGHADINIAFMAVGRLQTRGEALMVLTLDENASPKVQAQISAIPGINGVRLLKL